MFPDDDFPDDLSDAAGGPDRGWNHEPSRADLFEAFTSPVYTTDAEGWLTFYNTAASDLWGYRPELGRTRWCGAWRIFTPEGELLPHERCPMAIAIREGRAVRGIQAVLERPDGTRIPFMPYPTPLRDASGTLVAASNVLLPITVPGRAEPLEAPPDLAWDSPWDSARASTRDVDGRTTPGHAGYEVEDLTGNLQLTLAALADVEFGFRADRARLDGWVGPAEERDRILAQLELRRDRARARLNGRLERLRRRATRVMAADRPTGAAQGASLH
ncbi:histidine kinase [Methylobacterium sp. NEAU 140]|uniref:histidine kinase n=1 Tax=Methylobacterium sp. NEAU 140 TaxID=3064945 RepID=UPI0027361B81|nr:histidine kinase [Methylobacterium sp. NEAU 140]MDP4025436.1 histidine kinase [Methylobacterium sp. NEAU 140]